MNKIKETTIIILGSIVVLYGMSWITLSFLEKYPIFHFTKAMGSGVNLSSEKNLYTPSKYYADLWIKSDSATENTIKNRRISKNQLHELRNGNSIHGYTSDGQDFYTFSDILSNSVVYVIGFGIACILLIVIIILTMETFGLDKQVYYFLEKYIKIAGWKLFTVPILSIIILVLACYSLLFIINLGQKLYPFNKEVYRAEIIDKSYHDVYIGDSTYYLDISFETKSGEVVLLNKEVSYRTYRRNGEIDMAVLKNNPYDAFIDRLTIPEIGSAMFSDRMFIIFILFPIFLICYRIIWTYQKPN